VNERTETLDVVTQDERIMAALAHSTVIWPTLGLLAPLVIWGVRRGRNSPSLASNPSRRLPTSSYFF